MRGPAMILLLALIGKVLVRSIDLPPSATATPRLSCRYGVKNVRIMIEGLEFLWCITDARPVILPMLSGSSIGFCHVQENATYEATPTQVNE